MRLLKIFVRALVTCVAVAVSVSWVLETSFLSAFVVTVGAVLIAAIMGDKAP